MGIRKIILLITTIVFSISLVSCGSAKDKMINSRLNELNSSSKSKKERINKMVDILKNKDKETLKSMFSVSALKTAKNIDESIDYVMNFFDGEIISVDDASNGGSSSNSDGISVAEETYRCSVTTDKGKYLMFFYILIKIHLI